MRAKKLIIVLFWQEKLKTTETYMSELWHFHSRELHHIGKCWLYSVRGQKQC